VSPEPLLAGLRVVEVGQYISAPFAATLLADQGAKVVKIERPGGDPYRRDPARYAAWNRGKTSVELDLSAAGGRADALELIDGADVLIENLRPGALDGLGLSLDELRAHWPGLVTCSISAYGSRGPSRDDPGWEPLVHARAGAQQGLFTAGQPIWLPFPMASVAAGLFAVLGVGAALVKRETTGYGQHVETSLFEALLFLNGGPIFHRAQHRPGVGRAARTPVLRMYESSDGRGVMVNLSGTERWRELCRLLGLDADGDSGLDFADPASLAKLADRDWSNRVLDDMTHRFASRTADEWEEALLITPAAVSKCNTLHEWLAHEQARANGLFADVDDPALGKLRLVGPPVRIHVAAAGDRVPSRRHGSGAGALGGHRVIDMSSFWAGPLAARLIAELGADVIKVEPPGGEGAYQLMAMLPNIYVDGNRSKRGLTLDLRGDEDRHRLLDLVGAADVVVENAVAGTWERLDLDEEHLRAVNPNLVYARAKGFGLHGPLASRPAFDYVVQAATGMEMTQGGGRAQPTNFTANDYCTGIHLAVGTVLALLARARGAAVTSVDASLMMTATVFQSEHVAQIAINGEPDDEVGADLRGPTPGRHLYEAVDGWLAVCAVTSDQLAAIGVAFGIAETSVPAIDQRVRTMTVAAACAQLRAQQVPAAPSVHPSAVPDDEQVRDQALLATVRHPVAGRVVQVGIPVHLSVDVPAVRGPAPAPLGGRRTDSAPR
jgi:crotonobetainyl-CoA:carnitine CoA-transferase CaiB-like acyl-CoA transferase